MEEATHKKTPLNSLKEFRGVFVFLPRYRALAGAQNQGKQEGFHFLHNRSFKSGKLGIIWLGFLSKKLASNTKRTRRPAGENAVSFVFAATISKFYAPIISIIKTQKNTIKSMNNKIPT